MLPGEARTGKQFSPKALFASVDAADTKAVIFPTSAVSDEE